MLQKASAHHIDAVVIKNTGELIHALQQHQTDLIVLAGYLALIPAEVIAAFPHRIINIHPALLPKYGGKGMFGKKVHESVLSNAEKETGITIHEVDEIYDNGKIIFQHRVPVTEHDTTQSVEKKVREAEYYFLPRIIEKILTADGGILHP